MNESELKQMIDSVYLNTAVDPFEELKKEMLEIINERSDQLVKLQSNVQTEIMQCVTKKQDNYVTIYWRAEGNAKIPSKRPEDAGLDLYTVEDNVVLRPHETHSFKTGLFSIFAPDFWVEFKERGSTGSLGLATRSGVIDSGYRGEWIVTLTNVNNFPIEVSSKVDKVTYIYSKIFKKKIKKVIYPTSKAIAQAVIIPLPKVYNGSWESVDDSIKVSERGVSGWGASGK